MPRSARYCPPGQICFSTHLGDTLLILVIVALAFFLVAAFWKQYASVSPVSGSLLSPTLAAALAPPPPPQIQIVNRGGDSRYDRAPQPLRDWMAPPEFPPRGGLTALPVNIPTRGLPESFQSVGIVTVEDKVLPLYGRRTAGGSDRWNYYTRTDTYNPVPLPVRFQKRDCMDDTGCQELMSGETVRIDGLHKEGKTELYRFDGPKYIPGMI